jgi:hypothetical protein
MTYLIEKHMADLLWFVERLHLFPKALESLTVVSTILL